MKKLIILIAVIMALLFTGCCPDICPAIPDCICPAIPDCICPEIESIEKLPDIVYFIAEPEVIYDISGMDCSTLSWVVTGADTVIITPEIGDVDAVGNWEICWYHFEGTVIYTLIATNSVGSNYAKVTVESEE